jgi:allophanate hydrolase subunit 1
MDHKILIEGDSSVLIVFGDAISAETNQRFTATVKLIKEQRIEGIWI